MNDNANKKEDLSKYKDERKANTNLEGVISQVIQCKTHLESLLDKLGANEAQLIANNLDWPTLLASFGIISSDMISINKLLKERSCKDLKNCVFIPRAFSEDVDPNLQELTQHRMSIFNHDLIPHILRTKLLPELEEKEMQILRATRDFEQRKNGEKNIGQFKKRVSEWHEALEKNESVKQQMNMQQATYNPNDTLNLAQMFVTTSNRPRVMPFSPMANR